MSWFRAMSPALLVLLGGLGISLFAACQGGATYLTDDERAAVAVGDPDADAPDEGDGAKAPADRPTWPLETNDELAGVSTSGRLLDSPANLTSTLAEVLLEPGPYATDPRFRRLAADWGPRVDRALERMAVVTGLDFEKGAAPQVVLASLGDERVPYELRAEVRDGRRRVRLLVNAEPLLGGVRRTDRVLLRALGAAALEDAARRHGAVARWLVALAGTAAAGDLSDRIAALHRRGYEGNPDVLRVDPEDASAAEATSLAALLLVTRSGDPEDLRRLLRFVVDGDPAGEVLGRIARQPAGGWTEPARILLRERLAELPGEPWRLLRIAGEALDDAGRAGLEAALADGVPREIRAEVRVMRARAATAEGDHAEARAQLRGLEADAPARLRDPAAALALRIRVESRRGGDPHVARELAGHLDRDFPRSSARRELRSDHPLLGMEQDPQRWLVLTRTRIAEQGTDALDLRTLERYARTLLQDHRAGEAERLLVSLADRGRAPELAAVTLAVGEAQTQPSAAARQRNAVRVEAWRTRRGEAEAQAVRDGGTASAPALLALLEPGSGVRRRAVLALLVESAGTRTAIAWLARDWSRVPANVARDLDHLLAVVSYPDLTAAVSDATLQSVGIVQPSALWTSLRLGMDPAWLAEHPRFLADIRSPEYVVRREAFDLVAGGDPRSATPQVVGRALGDTAALLRREGVRAAGRAGFEALARRGLGDRSWLVREEAVVVVAGLEGERAVGALIERLRTDEVMSVRRAAAVALMRTAPEDPVVLRALVNTQIQEDTQLRELVAAGLAELDPMLVGLTIEQVWQVAVRRRSPHRGFLFRTAVLFQRATGVDVGYTPEATRAALQQMWMRMKVWATELEAREGRRRSGR